MHIPRLIISGPHRSSGKTTLSIGLCAALTRAGLTVQPFKKGPDYIDPMWLTAASGRDCRNLDLFMMGEDKIRESFQAASAGAAVSIIEGNMGLYDGMEVDGTGSTSDMARLLKAPVVLMIDASKMTRSIAPLVNGFNSFEPDITIAGVVLNKVSGPRHEAKLKAAIDRYCGVEVIGAVRRLPEIGIIQRHLGLRPAREDPEAASVVNSIMDIVNDAVDLKKVVSIAESASPLAPVKTDEVKMAPAAVRLGIAQDRAFTFYYPENIEALQAAGAELVPFSPLTDSSLPPVNGLYLGGGFPEVFMEELEANRGLRRQIREAVEAGMPVYAECGGLMYLARSMSWKGANREMVGGIPCDIEMHKKPQGHGYIRLKATGAGGWLEAGTRINAHEFHYSEIVNLGKVDFAYELLRGRGVDGRHDGIVHKNIVASYAHVHSLGAPGWAKSLVSFVSRAGFVPEPPSTKSRQSRQDSQV